MTLLARNLLMIRTPQMILPLMNLLMNIPLMNLQMKSGTSRTPAIQNSRIGPMTSGNPLLLSNLIQLEDLGE